MFLAAPEARAVQRKVKPRRQQYHNTHSQIVHAQRSGKADAKAGTAAVTMKPGTDEEALKAAVAKAGYVFLGIE